jgi:hypothetical protein
MKRVGFGDPATKPVALVRVPIPQKEPWHWLVARKGFHDLLGRPFSGGIGGDVEVDDASAIVGENEDEDQEIRHG